MLREEAIEVVPTWAQEDQGSASYREIDKQLRRLAKQKARIEVDEAKWLREAERLRIWRKLGYSTALEYLEDVFGYAPRSALDRLRVAKELGELPALEAEVRAGALPWSAARELTRVMTPATEARWLERARGRNVADISALVSGHRKGDDPDAPKDPALMTRRLVLDLPPALDALFEKTRLALQTERGEHLDDLAVFETMCMCALEPAAPAGDGRPPKPMHRIVTYKCEDCFRAWREGRGRLVPVAAAAVELAACDAELVREPGPAVSAKRASGDVVDADANALPDAGASARPDADANARRDPGASARPDAGANRHPDAVGSKHRRVETKRRPRATLTIPKATRDFVWARDCGRCRVPGCRATRNLACHHLKFQSQGGDHDAANLVLLCDGHHKLLHDGLITITGRAPDALVFMRGGKRLVDGRSPASIATDATVRTEVGGSDPAHVTKRSRFEDVVTFEHAKQALMQLGYNARAARAALNEVCAHVGADAEVASLVKAVLDRERHTNSRPPVADNAQTDATAALVQLGYPRPIASSAVAAASAHVGADADLTALIREALRRCSS